MRDKVIFWAPRALAIVFICFLAVFSLDVFEHPAPSVWMMMVALLIHNVPSLVLLAVVVVAWKRELVGTVVFGGAGLLYVVWYILHRPGLPAQTSLAIALSWSLVIAGPAFLIAALFLTGWRRKRSRGNPPPDVRGESEVSAPPPRNEERDRPRSG